MSLFRDIDPVLSLNEERKASDLGVVDHRIESHNCLFRSCYLTVRTISTAFEFPRKTPPAIPLSSNACFRLVNPHVYSVKANTAFLQNQTVISDKFIQLELVSLSLTRRFR